MNLLDLTEEQLDARKQRVCRECGVIKDHKLFKTDKKSKYGIQKICRLCDKTKYDAMRQKHRERYKTSPPPSHQGFRKVIITSGVISPNVNANGNFFPTAQDLIAVGLLSKPTIHHVPLNVHSIKKRPETPLKPYEPVLATNERQADPPTAENTIEIEPPIDLTPAGLTPHPKTLEPKLGWDQTAQKFTLTNFPSGARSQPLPKPQPKTDAEVAADVESRFVNALARLRMNKPKAAGVAAMPNPCREVFTDESPEQSALRKKMTDDGFDSRLIEGAVKLLPKILKELKSL